MALVKCYECDGTVSTEAMACPKCGAVQQKPESELAAYFRFQIIGWLVFVFALLTWAAWTALTR